MIGCRRAVIGPPMGINPVVRLTVSWNIDPPAFKTPKIYILGGKTAMQGIRWALFSFFVSAAAQTAVAADAHHYSFGYDQPRTTGYGVLADIFAAKLGELSKDTMAIDQFPGASLGQEPQMLQKIRTGDIDFIIS